MRQLTPDQARQFPCDISKLPMRQLTRIVDGGKKIMFSKLPMRQLTHFPRCSLYRQISKLPMRQLTAT